MTRWTAVAAVAFALAANAAAASAAPTSAQAVQLLAHRYYAAVYAASPTSATDAGLHSADDRLADFSAAADAGYAARVRGFRDELAKLAPGGASVHDQIDYLLLRADIEGDWWQRTYLRPEARNPSIYESECSNGIFSLLKRDFASTAVRARLATARLRACPRVLRQGEANLTGVVREFAVVASQDIAGGDALYTQSLSALAVGIPAQDRRALFAARDEALAALHAYKRWIDARTASWHAGGFAVGKTQYEFYLRRALLLPFGTEQLRRIAQVELVRDRALEAWEAQRERYAPSTAPPSTAPLGGSAADDMGKAQFLAYYQAQTARLRTFVASHHIVTVPPYIGTFKIEEVPAALAPIYPGGFMNPPGPFERDNTGFYFVPDYDPSNSSFFAAQARQTVLPVLGHEGIPGHFLQYSIANHNLDFVRRMHNDGVFAEGWAFYGEEMLMRCGLYDDDPAARRAVIHLMRHRATRVGVDIGLATGAMTLPQAIAYFQANAGIDRATAYGEATRFAMYPGQAIDYLTGKTQIESLLADYLGRRGAAAPLEAFHDRLLSYGTVPYATIAWEWFGDRTWIDRVRDPLAPVRFDAR